MFSLFKRKEPVKVPEWASFFSAEEYSTFIEQLDVYFRSIQVDYVLTADGVIQPKANDFGFNFNMGLLNVSQVCKQNTPDDYQRVIADHFNSIINHFKFEQEFEQMENDYEKVKDYIGVRLYNLDYISQLGKHLTIGKDFAGDIYAMIVFDFPDTVKNVKAGLEKVWGKTIDELFATGVENIKENYPLEISKESFGEFSVWFVQGDHFFAPNIVFSIDDMPELTGSKGALIGLPHRHAAIIYPIESLEVVTALNRLTFAVHGMNAEGPGSLSDNIFWYRDGVFTPLPYKMDDKSLQLFPPDSFVSLLNELAPA